MKPLFNSPSLGPGKLVRDGVPAEIAARRGTEPVALLPPEELLPALLAKLQEETFEVVHAKTRKDRLAELADVLEVLSEIAKVEGSVLGQVGAVRWAKRDRKGGFERGYFLREEDIPKETS